jgi:hypothetical protein
MFYLQLAMGIVSLLIGITQMTKESMPLVKTIVAQSQSPNPNFQYRYSDTNYRYYSDPTGRYWSRVNVQGYIEYAEIPTTVR